MMRRSAFSKKLRRESARWTSLGLLREDQRERILDLYVRPKVEVSRRLPGIVVGLATVLLCVGVILFYAANWRRMSTTLKLIQVFGLHFGAHAAAYYFLAIRRSRELLGRAFLMIGMVSFGVGIILVAQVFHISSHPADGVLAWSLGALLTAWVARERWGYYLTALLITIWNGWEYFHYHNPNYGFVILALILLHLFHRERERVGIGVALFQIGFWFYQVNLYWIDLVEPVAGMPVFLLLHIPLGVVLLSWRRRRGVGPTIDLERDVLRFAGWTAVFVPLIGLSWPMDLSYRFFFLAPELTVFSLEYLTLSVVAFWLVLRRPGKKVEDHVVWAIAASGLFFFFLPLGHKATAMVTTHLGLMAYLFGLLYLSYVSPSAGRLERFLALGFSITSLAVKALGFLMLGVRSERYLLAYCTGFLVFGTVCFLINECVSFLTGKLFREYPAYILQSVAAFLGFVTIYVLSSELPVQASLFTLETLILITLFFFISVAILLYVYLFWRGSEPQLLILSAVIFFLSVVVLVFSGPEVSWIVYSVAFNALLFVMVASMIYYSTQINSVRLANLAIAGFLVHIITRYFDLIWDLFSGSILFITTGLVALVGGFLLEKSRRGLMSNIRRSRPAIEEAP